MLNVDSPRVRSVLSEYFVRMLTEHGDLVIDPYEEQPIPTRKPSVGDNPRLRTPRKEMYAELARFE